MRRIAAALVVLALGACSAHLREAVPDAPMAIATAVKLCNWDPSWQTSPNLHAERTADKWRVWDDRGGAEAYLNRYDTRGTYVCVGL